MNLCGVCVVFVEALAMQNYKSLFKIFACSKFLNKEEFLNKHAAKIHKINELHKKSYNFYFKTSSMDDAFLLSLNCPAHFLIQCIFLHFKQEVANIHTLHTIDVARQHRIAHDDIFWMVVLDGYQRTQFSFLCPI